MFQFRFRNVKLSQWNKRIHVKIINIDLNNLIEENSGIVERRSRIF